MVTKEEIEKVAKLMRIELDDPIEYTQRVKKMLSYFDLLDKANIETEEPNHRMIPLDDLREDKFIPYGEKLIEHLKKYKGTYVQAPKMI